MAAAGFEEGRARTGPTGLDTRDVVVPLTRTRVAETLTALGYPLFRDAAGNLGLLWAQSVFHIYLLGEEETVLQVRTSWHRRLALERLGEVLGLLDRWNREFIGPKCYVRVLDDGRLSVVAEASTPLGTGVSDHQAQRPAAPRGRAGHAGGAGLEAAYPDPAGLPPEETP